MYETVLLSKAVAEKTGYTEDEAKQILLGKVNKDSDRYKNAIETKAIEPSSWAAITTSFATSNPDFYIKVVGKKRSK